MNSVRFDDVETAADAVVTLAAQVHQTMELNALNHELMLQQWRAVYTHLRQCLSSRVVSIVAPSRAGKRPRDSLQPQCRRCRLRDDFDGHSGSFCSASKCRHCHMSYASIIDTNPQRRHGPSHFCRVRYGASLERRFTRPTFQRTEKAPPPSPTASPSPTPSSTS